MDIKDGLRWLILPEVTKQLTLYQLLRGAAGLEQRVQGNTLGQLLGPFDRLWRWLGPGAYVLLLAVLGHTFEVVQVRASGVELLDDLVFLVQQVLGHAPVHTWNEGGAGGT